MRSKLIVTGLAVLAAGFMSSTGDIHAGGISVELGKTIKRTFFIHHPQIWVK